METVLQYNGSDYRIDLDQAIDISIPLVGGEDNVNAYYIKNPEYEVFAAGGFVGSVAQGGACNCENIHFNPHGNGTHTECVGHVSNERITINSCLKKFHFIASLVTIEPEELENGDRVIGTAQLPERFLADPKEALIIRSWPNKPDKLSKNYSGSNPVYLHPDLTLQLRKLGVKHLMVDFPSVDKEDDGGLLVAHKNFWNYPEEPRMDATITEMFYAPDSVVDGDYLLNIQIASFESDASPSKPVLFVLKPV
jgi:kynurenine formamidase